MDLEGQSEKAMRVQTHHPSRRGRPSKRNGDQARVGRMAARTVRGKGPQAFDMFSDRLDDRADYEQIIRDFESVHDAIVAADEYDS
jgi:hypothetical protein